MITKRTFRHAIVAALMNGLLATAAAQYQGWLIPAGGKEEKSPLKPGPEVVKRGQALFMKHCTRCHGPEGRGNGADSDHAADLTDPFRDGINTEGVLFYKVWNGHTVQLRVEVEDMPAFKDTLTREEVWAIVEYLKVLRTPSR